MPRLTKFDARLPEPESRRAGRWLAGLGALYNVMRRETEREKSS